MAVKPSTFDLLRNAAKKRPHFSYFSDQSVRLLLSGRDPHALPPVVVR